MAILYSIICLEDLKMEVKEITWVLDGNARHELSRMWELNTETLTPFAVELKFRYGIKYLCIITTICIIAIPFYILDLSTIAGIITSAAIISSFVHWHLTLSAMKIILYQMRNPFTSFDSVSVAVCHYLQSKGFDAWIIYG
jgi:hypothetical protein